VVTRLANRSRYKDPDEVADAVENALFDPNSANNKLIARYSRRTAGAISGEVRLDGVALTDRRVGAIGR
jgi:hypothetical protein